VKETLEIAPEVRGLIEEVVRDPRSAIRLAPRRALRTWFDTGETARASDITYTAAERHLVEVHREALAELLCQASWVSYWKRPVFAIRPTDAKGELYNPKDLEGAWREQAERELRSHDRSEGVEMLRQCLTGIASEQGTVFARASLALVPRDQTRFSLAVAIPWGTPRTAIALLNPLARRAQPKSIRQRALLALGARTCALGLFREARALYREDAHMESGLPSALAFAFNLSCVLEDPDGALADAIELGRQVNDSDPRLAEAVEVLHVWIQGQADDLVRGARSVASRLSGCVSGPAATICQEYAS
jgi:hypothetical protein